MSWGRAGVMEISGKGALTQPLCPLVRKTGGGYTNGIIREAAIGRVSPKKRCSAWAGS